MSFQLIMMILTVAMMVLSGLLMKAPKAPPSALGDLQAPTAEEGRNLPVIFGTVLCKAPNVTWYGDYLTTAIKKSMGIMAFGRKATIGWRYFLGMDLHLCHGQVDELVDVRAGNGDDQKHLNWTQTGTNADGSAQVKVDDANCFGGDEKEGGISGTGTFYYGSVDQESDAYMSAKLGIVYPAYRGVSHFVLNRWYLGTSNYIKNISLVLRRCPNNLGLTDGQVNIAGDANPAEVIYECLHVKAWALGIAAPRFDLASFHAAGAQLATEGLGVSFQLDQPHDADAAVTEVLRHIDGVCYTDPASGLWTLQLVRAVDPATLPEYGPDEIAECEFTRGSWEQTTNEIKVRYIDRATFKDAVAQVQESANYAIRGELVSAQVDFLSLSNATIAQRIATREVRTHSYPMGTGRVKLNRKAWALRMGEAFLLTWPALGIGRMAVRITSIDYGALDHGAIEVEFVEDIFDVAYTAYGVPSASGWTDPVGDPQPPAAELLLECPYELLGVTTPQVREVVLCARNDVVSQGYEVWKKEGTEDEGDAVKCLPHSSRGTVALGDVTPATLIPVQRASAPYPPGNVQVNGLPWPDGATLHGDATLTWAHRIRGTGIVHQDAPSMEGSIEGSYTVEVLVGGVVKQTYTGLTGTSQAYTWTQRQLDDADLTKAVTFRITPVNGAISGKARTTDTFVMAA